MVADDIAKFFREILVFWFKFCESNQLVIVSIDSSNGLALNKNFQCKDKKIWISFIAILETPFLPKESFASRVESFHEYDIPIFVSD